MPDRTRRFPKYSTAPARSSGYPNGPPSSSDPAAARGEVHQLNAKLRILHVLLIETGEARELRGDRFLFRIGEL